MKIPWGKSRFPAVAVIPALICFLSAVLPAEAGPARLNNFVVELADVDISRIGARERVETEMDMEGWIYILLEGEGEIGVRMTAGGESKTVLEEPGETMRYIPAGRVTLDVSRARGASPERLKVRRVAEVKAYNIEPYEPASPEAAIRHSWDFWEEALLHSANVVTSRPHRVYESYAQRWQEEGGRWLRRQSIRPLWDEDVDPAEFFSEIVGGKVWDGATLDELLPRDATHYERYGDGLARFSQSPEGKDKYVYWWIWSLGTRGNYGARRVLETVSPDIARNFRVTGEASVYGNKSLKVFFDGGGAVRTRQLNIMLEPGEEYTLSAYMRGEGVLTGSRTGLFVIDQRWENEYGRLLPVQGDSEWRRYEKTFVPDESNVGSFRLVLTVPEAGSIWIDAVQLERGGNASDFTVGGKNKIRNPDFGNGLYGWMAGSGEALPLMDVAVKYGHVFVQEMYLLSESTEYKAYERIARPLALLAEAFEMYDGPLQRNVLIAPLVLDLRPWAYSGNYFPGVNYKVFLDMQMHAMATREGLEDLRGVGMWVGGQCKQETLKWFGELLRHYCIEGNTEKLSNDPYKLPHIENAGFEKGIEGWNVLGNVDAVNVEDMPDNGRIGEGRPPAVPSGTVLRTFRGEGEEANSFGQKIRELEPGRLYSVKVYSADPEYSDRLIQADISIEGGEVRPEGEKTEQFSEGKWSHVWRLSPPDQEVNWTMHYRIFRASETEGYLKISDAEPGELFWDFVQVAPFFEK